MKADLKLLGNIWSFYPEDKSIPTATLVGHTHELALKYAMMRGATQITEWRDGRQICTHFIPKETLGKGECSII